MSTAAASPAAPAWQRHVHESAWPETDPALRHEALRSPLGRRMLVESLITRVAPDLLNGSRVDGRSWPNWPVSPHRLDEVILRAGLLSLAPALATVIEHDRVGAIVKAFGEGRYRWVLRVYAAKQQRYYARSVADIARLVARRKWLHGGRAAQIVRDRGLEELTQHCRGQHSALHQQLKLMRGPGNLPAQPEGWLNADAVSLILRWSGSR